MLNKGHCPFLLGNTPVGRLYTDVMAVNSRLTVEQSHTSDSLHLLCLPFEIRAIIWQRALGGIVFDVCCWPSYSPEKIATRVTNSQRYHCSLLRTCKQIHSEAHESLIRCNGFRFKNEDAIVPWLERFDSPKRMAIAEVHLVTWRATNMVEGHSSSYKPLMDVLPLESLLGLKRLHIEVRTKRSCRSCWHDCCKSCDTDLELAEARLLAAVAGGRTCAIVSYSRQCFASFAAAIVL